jgi:hypothetical protein
MGDKWRPARKADNLTVICEPIVWKMWERRPLTNLWAFTAVTGVALPFTFYKEKVQVKAKLSLCLIIMP